METYGGAAGSTLSTSTTMYIGAIEAVEFAQRLGLQSFKLVVKGDIVPQQILWLQEGEPSSGGAGWKISSKPLRPAAERLNSMLEAVVGRSVVNIDTSHDTNAGLYTDLELRAQELLSPPT